PPQPVTSAADNVATTAVCPRARLAASPPKLDDERTNTDPNRTVLRMVATLSGFASDDNRKGDVTNPNTTAAPDSRWLYVGHRRWGLHTPGNRFCMGRSRSTAERVRAVPAPDGRCVRSGRLHLRGRRTGTRWANVGHAAAMCDRATRGAPAPPPHRHRRSRHPRCG